MDNSALEPQDDSTRDRIYRAQKRLYEIITDPRIDKASSLCTQGLNLIAQVGQAGASPVAWLAAAGSVINMSKSIFSFNTTSPIDQFLMGWSGCTSNLPAVLARSELLTKDCGLDLVFEDPDTSTDLVGRFDGESGFLFKVCKSNNEWCVKSVIYRVGDNGLKMLEEFISESVWKKYDSTGLELTEFTSAEDSDSWYGFEPLPDVPIPYVGKKDPVKFADKVDLYRRKGISYSVIFYGLPGTGKSTFIMNYAELTRSKLLIVGPGVWDRLRAGEVEMIIGATRPDILLLDDLDKAKHVANTYTTLPKLKLRYPKMLIAVTCNHPVDLGSAMLRPGRGGVLEEFFPPDAAERRQLLELYMQRAGSPLENFDLDALSAAFSPRATHDWIRQVAEDSVLYDTQQLLMELIVENNKKQELIGEAWSVEKGPKTSSKETTLKTLRAIMDEDKDLSLVKSGL